MEPEIKLSSQNRSSFWPPFLLGILVSSLAWLKIKPVDSQPKQINSSANTEHRPAPATPILTPEPRIPETISHQQEPAKKRRKIPDWLKFIVNVLTLAAVVWYAIEAMKQRVAMEGTLKQVQEQTKFQREQTVGTYAAVIAKNPPWPQTISNDLDFVKFQGIGMDYQNVGKIKARNFVAEASFERQRLPAYSLIGTRQHKEIGPVDIGLSTVPGQGAAEIKFDVSGLTQRDLELIQTLGETFKIEGHLQYSDGFDDSITERFCYLYVIFVQHSFGNAASTGGGAGWTSCEDGKLAIANSLKWLKTQRSNKNEKETHP